MFFTIVTFTYSFGMRINKNYVDILVAKFSEIESRAQAHKTSCIGKCDNMIQEAFTGQKKTINIIWIQSPRIKSEAI